MKIVPLVCSLVPLCGVNACVVGEVPEAVPHYSFLVRDNLAQRRFDLEITSEDERLLCVYADYWPNDIGELDEGSLRSSVELDGAVLRGKNGIFGYSPAGSSVYVISPSSSLVGFISYSSFGDPDVIAKSANRRLIFSLAPRLCTKEMLKRRFGSRDESR